jgi:hypothetical protein
MNQMLLETKISLLDETDEIFDCFDVNFLLFLALLFVFLLHTTLDPAILSVTSVVLLCPCEGLVGCKVLPVVVKGEDFVNMGS